MWVKHWAPRWYIMYQHLWRGSSRKVETSDGLDNWRPAVTKSCPTCCNLMDCSAPGSLSFLLDSSPGVCSDSCSLNWWYHRTILSSAALFSFCLQSSPVSGYFPVSQFFASGGQSIGASASASILPINIKGWFPLGLTGLIL